MQYAIHRFESVTSTNDIAIRMAEEGAPEGTVVVAREQTAGRGRRGRSWSSPPGTGLYLSVVLQPGLTCEQLWQMAFVASVAAAEAVGRASGLPARIKWPNDVLLNERKACGILVEARKPSARGGQPTAIVGIGLNVNTEEFPPEIAQTATSIALELGRPVPVAHVEDALLASLDARYGMYLAEGFAPVFQAWKGFDCTVGRHVAVDTPDGVVAGAALGLDSEGNLVIEGEDGVSRRVTAGEVILRGSV